MTTISKIHLVCCAKLCLVCCAKLCLVCCGISAALTSCSKDIEAPALPSPESVAVAQGVSLDPNQLFGI